MLKISLLTAAHCNLNGLKKIYHSIADDLCENINWVIKDSGDCLETFDWVSSLQSPYVIFLRGADTGIYNALNTAIPYCHEYYLTCGSDDLIYPGSLTQVSGLLNKVASDADLLLFPVLSGGKVIRPGNRPHLTISLRGWISSHSLGCVIKSDLHNRFGLYDETYKILADSKFLTLLGLAKLQNVYVFDYITGEFTQGGISSTHINERISEAYRYHLELQYGNYTQILLYFLRHLNFSFKRVYVAFKAMFKSLPR